jgi:hypothetical protein
LVLNIHQGPVKHILRERLLLQEVNFKWIRHLLGDNQKLKMSRLSAEVLEFFESKSRPLLANGYIGCPTGH